MGKKRRWSTMFLPVLHPRISDIGPHFHLLVVPAALAWATPKKIDTRRRRTTHCSAESMFDSADFAQRNAANPPRQTGVACLRYKSNRCCESQKSNRSGSDRRSHFHPLVLMALPSCATPPLNTCQDPLSIRLFSLHLFDHATIIARVDLDKAGQQLLPLFQNLLGRGTAGIVQMTLNQGMKQHLIFPAHDRFQINHRCVAALRKIPLHVQNIGYAPAHAGREIPAGLTQNNDNASRHVLAPMVTHSFDDGMGPAVAHRESLPCHAAEKSFSTGGAVKDGIAN
jgi:hypothetical protein